jgi:hypothetical protein
MNLLARGKRVSPGDRSYRIRGRDEKKAESGKDGGRKRKHNALRSRRIPRRNMRVQQPTLRFRRLGPPKLLLPLLLTHLRFLNPTQPLSRSFLPPQPLISTRPSQFLLALPIRRPHEQSHLRSGEFEADLSAGTVRTPCSFAVPFHQGEGFGVGVGFERGEGGDGGLTHWVDGDEFDGVKPLRIVFPLVSLVHIERERERWRERRRDAPSSKSPAAESSPSPSQSAMVPSFRALAEAAAPLVV